MKVITTTALLALCLSSAELPEVRLPVRAQSPSGAAILQVDTDRRMGRIDAKIYGQVLEHINHPVEDGLVAGQIRRGGVGGRGFGTYWTGLGSPGAVRVVEEAVGSGPKSVRVSARNAPARD